MSIKMSISGKPLSLCLLFSLVSPLSFSADDNPVFYLNNVEFAEDLGITGNDINCDVESVLTYTIIETMGDRSFKVIPISKETVVPSDAFSIKVTIEDYNKPKVALPGMRASLNVHAELFRQGEVISKFDRTSASGNLVLGMCHAMKNTAEYLGVAVSKWALHGSKSSTSLLDIAVSENAQGENEADEADVDNEDIDSEDASSGMTLDEAKNHEVSHYLDMVNKGALADLQRAKSEVQAFAIDDVRLHDEVEKLVLAGYVDVSDETLPRLANLVMFLAASGNEKYLPTLDLVKQESASSRLSRYAEKAETVLKIQAIDKVVINKDIDSAKPDQRFQKRIGNMINSGDTRLVKRGLGYARKYYLSDKEVLGTVKQFITDNYLRNVEGYSEERQFIRLMYSMMTFLVSSPADSKPLLINISKNAGEPKLKKIARKLLKKMKSSS